MLPRRLCYDEVRYTAAGRAMLPIQRGTPTPELARPRHALASALYLVCCLDARSAFHLASAFLLDELDSMPVAMLIDRARHSHGVAPVWRSSFARADCPSGHMLAGETTLGELCASAEEVDALMGAVSLFTPSHESRMCGCFIPPLPSCQLRRSP